MGASAYAATRPGPPFQTIGTETSDDPGGLPRLLGDGSRYVHWVSSDGTSMALDVRTGVRRAGLVPVGCRASAVGGGELLYACGTDADRVERIVDLGTGRTHDINGLQRFRKSALPAAEQPILAGVGRQWVSGDAFDTNTHSWRRAYLNWHTGAVVTGAVTGRSIADLDLSGLRLRMCRPFRRPPLDVDDRQTPLRGHDFLYQYERPFGIGVGTGRRPDLVLSRCGGRKRIVLVRVRRFGAIPGPFRDGIVTWQHNHDSGAYVIRSRRRYKWPEYNADLTHAGDYAFRSSQQADGTWAIQRARIRR